MRHALPYTLSLSLPILLLLGLQWGGHWTWAVPRFMAVVIVLDACIGLRFRARDPSEEEARRESWLFDLVLWLHVPLQLAILPAVLYVIAFHRPPAPALLGLLLSTGIVWGTIRGPLGHELVHRTGRLAHWFGNLFGMMTCAPHFFVHHLHGHHLNAGLREDPATARLGESLWAYFPRMYFGTIADAWRIETARLERLGRSRWSPRNRVLTATAGTLLLLASILALFGPAALVFFLAASSIGILSLVGNNYIEHYGLERAVDADGRPAPFSAQHAWNAEHCISRWILLGEPRHSDHHLKASRPYPLLETHRDAPQHPAGYPAMVHLALFPPAWHALMDPLVLARRARALGIEPPSPEAASLGQRVLTAAVVSLAGLTAFLLNYVNLTRH